MPEHTWQSLAQEILSRHLGVENRKLTGQRLTGGCINEAFKIESDRRSYVLKINELDFEVQFEKEAAALDLLRATQTIKIPEVLELGNHGNKAFLLMEYVPSGNPDNQFWQDFGESLANLHRNLSLNGEYGLHFDNYIGELPQKNDFDVNWIDFFIHKRLEVQLKLAHAHRYISDNFLEQFRKIYEQLPRLLVVEPPSLLHGDLWSGNFLCSAVNQAVLIDPAVYYGNREVELAFTQLFGGFSSRFYESYRHTWPLQPGFEDRVDIYNLYPLLVHVNLFGTSYLSGIEKVIKRYT